MFYDTEIVTPTRTVCLESKGKDPFQAQAAALLRAEREEGVTFQANGSPRWEGPLTTWTGVLRGPDGGSAPGTVRVRERILVIEVPSQSQYRLGYSTRQVAQVEGHGQMTPREAHALARELRCRAEVKIVPTSRPAAMVLT